MSMIIYCSCQMQTGKKKKKSPPKHLELKNYVNVPLKILFPFPPALQFLFNTNLTIQWEIFSKTFPTKMRPNKFLLPTAAKKKKTFQLYLKFCLLFHYGQTCLQKQTFIASRTKEVSCLQISTNVRKQCFGLVWFFLHYSDRKKARSAPAFLAEFLGWNGLMIYIVHSYELS